MIAQLKGEVAEISGNSVVLMVGGVGYRVNVMPETIEEIRKSGNKVISLKTHLAVRETSLDLYGFLNADELEFFEMLISISGIGPKSGLAILSVADVSTLKTAVSSGDSSYLTKVSGIGRKSAGKIILELKDKLGAIDSKSDSALMRDEIETLEALQALGYSTREAREAMKKISKTATNSGERIKEALKILGKQE
ncbi:MAG: Holliday junction branch migration protein RuvA [Candidatus Pacebacteria bacterium]|jgi:Holliday junction DNA helicase RuvA|nr:Holliday junction branch migration protein RuvA [Candidatus Paceibacterota bacterium]MDP7159227.1 Holliday junction branch migration protein RuvA [Candidatus Paceibacterota bacterium]MDP7367882.1 Holliday junction branch migration protein RuvA [Candidatus Paceibacterota bacterium]MDP7466297.1 Holliday junction branch migration protein RuvA [Candidatus Paceibacterota bacterium]MDP7648115.1 Holliday junction branch migration protein RuvA [Candidatus Paceibacterota bacterium]